MDPRTGRRRRRGRGRRRGRRRRGRGRIEEEEEEGEEEGRGRERGQFKLVSSTVHTLYSTRTSLLSQSQVISSTHNKSRVWWSLII
jgi:hypothetical protein